MRREFQVSQTRRTVALAAAALTTALCLISVAAADAKSGGHESRAAAPIKLTIVTPGVGVAVSNAALAQGLGYFKAVGLDVTMESIAASSILNTIVSGQAQIGAYSVSAVDLATARGQYMTDIFGYQGNHQTGSLLARTGITTIAQLQALPHCKLATGTPGSSLYGYMNHYIKTLGLQNCSVTQFGDSTTAVGAVVSGAYDAGAFTYGDTINLVRQGHLNFLVNTSNLKTAIKYDGTPFTSNAWFGPSNWLGSHRATVKLFLKALGMADKALHTLSPARLGAALHGLPGTDWSATTSADYAQQFKDLLPFLDPNHGYITSVDYNAGLKAIGSWGITGFDPSNAEFKYLARVDMSYYQQAIGPNPSAKPKPKSK